MSLWNQILRLSSSKLKCHAEAFPSPCLMFWWHHWHPSMSCLSPHLQPNTDSAHRASPQSIRCPDLTHVAALSASHANLNSMIQQYWIHRFFRCVKWAQVWRTSHARARQRQRDAWSCRRANIMLRGCSDEAVKPSLVPSGLYYSFLKTCCLQLTSGRDFLFILPSGKFSKSTKRKIASKSWVDRFQRTHLRKWCDNHVFCVSAIQKRIHRRKRHETLSGGPIYKLLNFK